MERRSYWVMAAVWCLAAAAQAGEPRWFKITSPDFELYTDAGEHGGRDTARYFERVRSFFLEALGFAVQSGTRVRIVVFRSDREFTPYSPNEYAAAFYQASGDRDYIIMKSAAADHFEVAMHEYTHLLVRHTGIQPPVWFNEGLAEFYSNVKPLAGKIEVGDIIPRHVLLLRQSKWIDLPTLLVAEHDSPLYNEKSHAGIFYAESWALVHMLYLSDNYRGQLPVLLKGIEAHADMAETFRQAYGKSPAEVQKDLESYMAGNRFNAKLFDTKLTAAAEQPAAAEMDPLEADLLLAEIMAGSPGKAAEARAAFERLAREHPNDWRVEEGLARLSRRDLKRSEAMAHYARAAELGATDSRMYLEYGRLLRANDEQARAIAVLQHGTLIDPADKELRLELGFAYLTSDQFADALAQFQLAAPVPRERAFQYFHGMAYSYYRLNRKTDAYAAVVSGRTYAKTPEQNAQLDQLVETLDYEPREPVRPKAPPPTPLPVAEGTLEAIDCTDGKIRLHLSTGSQNLAFTLDPALVTMRDSEPVEFTCGPQKPKRIRVYYKLTDGLAGTLGSVRSIEFPK
ncbi:MAG TPA: hypothetical protein VMD77_02065 [Candidatus Baltobacteraceae bacterium]|nr:hypothetical protein [Candidatus Baltobacteraceae bacterium]